MVVVEVLPGRGRPDGSLEWIFDDDASPRSAHAPQSTKQERADVAPGGTSASTRRSS